mmetsp:Transcript_17593/g.50932  ORF Transcript_17593/g.50932 Transcript_17593/m.50932 type:complete len:214 (-) Transcript_17593:316-957(-)
MRLFRRPPLGVCAVESTTRRQCARLSGVSMSLDGASHHKVWIAMMRKVAQPESFLPEGMPGGAARPGWPRPDMALPDLHKAMTRHLVRLGGRGARVRRPACQASCRCAPTDPSLSPRWSTRCSRRRLRASSTFPATAGPASDSSGPFRPRRCMPTLRCRGPSSWRGSSRLPTRRRRRPTWLAAPGADAGSSERRRRADRALWRLGDIGQRIRL